MVNISRKDLERLAIGFGIADFLTEGRLSAPVARGTKTALKKAAPAIGRALIRYGPTVAITAARVTPGPVAAVAAGALAYQQRDRIRDVSGNIYERVAPAAMEAVRGAPGYAESVGRRALDPASYAPMGEPRDLLPLGGPIKRPTRKRLSKFNKAVKAGMTAVRNSTSYGKKGTINNAKKAFSAVTKVASKVNRGKKVSGKGVARTIARAVRRIL
tara:strand:- start:1089 stop:1733 length:645 start_codon:yes stop_codon:yes gene_type:complete